MSRFVDADALLERARRAPLLEAPAETESTARVASTARIGILRDSAFTFYYPENLEALGQACVDFLKDAGQADKAKGRTKMSFRLSKEGEIQDVIAYLQTFSEKK